MALSKQVAYQKNFVFKPVIYAICAVIHFKKEKKLFIIINIDWLIDWLSLLIFEVMEIKIFL